MKNLKLFILALGLFTINVSAANLNPVKPTDDLRVEIVDLDRVKLYGRNGS